jgi:hypothetical protein
LRNYLKLGLEIGGRIKTHNVEIYGLKWLVLKKNKYTFGHFIILGKSANKLNAGIFYVT